MIYSFLINHLDIRKAHLLRNFVYDAIAMEAVLALSELICICVINITHTLHCNSPLINIDQ